MATVEGRVSHAPMTSEEKKVIFASSLGTVFEWYDFYLAGSLAVYISKTFFSGVNPTAGFIFTLLGFAAGFAVRPFGAIVFGRLGDMVGRKYTFLVTIVIMGLSTFLIGFLPGYATIGIAAPIIFIAMRLLQGLALGGEYGGRDLCRGARAVEQARRLDSVDPDDCDPRPLHLADRDSRGAHHGRRRAVRRMGVAHSVPRVDPAARRVRVDPDEAA